MFERTFPCHRYFYLVLMQNQSVVSVIVRTAIQAFGSIGFGFLFQCAVPNLAIFLFSFFLFLFLLVFKFPG